MFYNYKAIYQKTGWYTWNWIFKLRAIDDDGFSILLIVICLLAFGCVMKIFIHIRSLIKKLIVLQSQKTPQNIEMARGAWKTKMC